MAKAALGFVVATLLFGGVFAILLARGVVVIPSEEEASVVATADEAAPVPTGTPRRARRVRARRQTPTTSTKRPPPPPARAGTTRDDVIDENPVTRLDLGSTGGEARIAPAEIERVFDESFRRVRACLALAADDTEIRGNLVFTLRVLPSGRVDGVRLSGPREVTSGEAGDCLRTLTRGMSFTPYDGPPSVGRYTVSLE